MIRRTYFGWIYPSNSFVFSHRIHNFFFQLVPLYIFV